MTLHRLQVIPVKRLPAGKGGSIVSAVGSCKCGWETPALSTSSVLYLADLHAAEHGAELKDHTST